MTLMQYMVSCRKSISVAATLAAVSATLIGCSPFRGALTESGSATPAIPGHGVTVYAAGDIADCRRVPAALSGAAATAAIIEAGLAHDPGAAVLTLGDHTYPVGLIEEFLNCYEPTWGRFKQHTFPAPGNHEYYSAGAAGYYRYFDKAAGDGNRGYYSRMLGTWHIVSLNSNLPPAEHQRQLAWLTDELRQAAAHCTLAYWHHPRFSSGGHGSNPRMADIWQVLESAGVDVVLAAHDHNYERFARQTGQAQPDDQFGIRQFVVGTGGARLTPILFRKHNSEVVYNATHGVLRLDLKETGYEWQFIPTNGDFRDRGATLCHPARPGN